jgi:PGF-pre-PGF domain-containing protein
MRLAFFLLFLLPFAFAQPYQPAIPAGFWGGTMVNGEPVPVGSVIIARIGGEERGSVDVLEQGYYGDADTDKKLAVIGTTDDQGETIKFYLKLPGKEQLEADETHAWLSGSLTQMNLTFDGEIVDEAVADDNSDDTAGDESGTGGSGSSSGSSSRSSSSSSSSSSHSSSGGVVTTSTKSEGDVIQDVTTIDYLNITAGQQVDIDLDGVVQKVQLILKKNVSNVRLTVTYNEQPQSTVDNAFVYFNIDTEGITPDMLDTVIVRFKVPNSWFENHTDPVHLMHLGDGWEELQTVMSGADEQYHYYRAEVKSFSLFAIASDKAVEEPTVQADAQPDTPDALQFEDANQATGAVTGHGKVVWTGIIGLMVVFAVIAGAYLWNRK